MKKTGKQTLSICLSLAMAVTSLATGSYDASAKAKLGTKKMTLTIGQKKKITIKRRKAKAKYLFSSSTKAKASVSKKGVVTAKKAGKATITVKEKSKKKTRKLGKVVVTVKPKQTKPATTPVPTNSPSPTPVASPSVSPSVSPSAVPTPTRTPRPSRTPGPTAFPEDPDFAVPRNMITKYDARCGQVEEFKYNSTAIDKDKVIERKAMVALPNGYKPTKQYPVVYALHGFNGWYKSMIDDGAPIISWNAAAEDKAQDVILVCPAVCANESGEQTVEAYDNFVNDMINCLMPAIEEHYPVLKGRENTALWGFSMGGRETLQIGFKHPDKFGYIGAMCAAPGVLDDYLNMPKEYADNTLILICKGAKDDVVKDSPLEYHKKLLQAGTPHLYYETMGFGGGTHYKNVFLHGYYNLLVRAFPSKK